MKQITRGPGDFEDITFDLKCRKDEALEAVSAELYANDAEISDALTDFLYFAWGDRNNDPETGRAIHALREGDYEQFGELCSRAVCKRIDQKALDDMEDAEDTY